MRIVFLRHAQSTSHHPGGDFTRPLTARGRRQAASAGRALAELGLEHAFVSGATRTRQTFAGLGLDIPATYTDDLYSAYDDEIFDVLNSADGVSARAVLVVGHAPSIHSCSIAFARAAADDEAFDALARRFPTGTFAAFDIAEELGNIDANPTGCRVVTYSFG